MSKRLKREKLRKRPVLEEVREDGGGFARALASTDGHTRERGLQALCVWLQYRKNITEKDLLRLWKALFYCFWHSDKGAVQADLADRLSEILILLPGPTANLYFKVFVRTMRREWFGIDRHRMEKFLMLTRKIYSAHLHSLQLAGWDVAMLTEYTTFWLEEVFVPKDTFIAAGFAYHVADLMLPELQKIVKVSGNPPPRPALMSLLMPFGTAAASTHDDVLVSRLGAGILSDIIQYLRQPAEQSALQNIDRKELADWLFKLGARPETRATNRKMLYEVSKRLEKSIIDQGKGVTNGAGPAAALQSKKSSHSDMEEGPSIRQNAGIAEKNKKSKKKSYMGKTAGDDAAVEKSKLSLATSTAKPLEGDAMPRKSKKRKSAGSKDDTISSLTLDGADEAAGGTPLAVVPEGDTAARRKSVRFSLKRNLVMTIGQPPLPADVRTPPTSKPKGPALKRSSGLASRKLSMGDEDLSAGKQKAKKKRE